MGGGAAKGIQVAIQAASQEQLQAALAELPPDARDKMAAALGAQTSAPAVATPPRPEGAVGTFLRMVTVNDVYVLKNYPKVASAITACKDVAASLDCVVTSHLNGDFLSPCVASSLDNGKAMMEGLNQSRIEYACLGNHEFDMGLDALQDQVHKFRGKLINSNVHSEYCASLPRYDAVKVGDRTVVFAGVVTANPAIYDAEIFASAGMTPVDEALKETWLQAKSEIGAPDIFIPMTHQLVHEDEATAKALSEVEDLKGRVPIILGGHEHKIFTPEVAGTGTRIVKMGQDCITIGFVDVWWDRDGRVHSSLAQVPAESFPDEPASAAWVKKQDELMAGLMSVPIARLPWSCSSKPVRTEESKLASLLLQAVKRALGVELALRQGGGIRGRADYEAGDFTLENLFTELPWDGPQAVIKVPGSVLVDTVRTMRSPEGEKPGFVHLDLDCEVGEGHRLLKIDDKPVDPERVYTVATDYAILQGMDNIEPLLTYAKSGKMRVPDDDDECIPIKQSILCVLMKDAWRELVGLGRWKPGSEGDMRKADLKNIVATQFREFDKDGNGFLKKDEIVSALKQKKLSCGLLERLIEAADTSGDGCISMEELVSVVH